MSNTVKGVEIDPVRENLIELLKSADDLPVVEAYDTFADYLIDNGMTIPVRCKDCKHFDCDYCWHEKMEHSRCRDYDFCSYGERKDNG